MQIELCDICEQPLITYTLNGHEYKPIHMKQKKAKKRSWSGLWEPMSICGECRAMLASKRFREEQENEHG